jgi:DNA modification methylase
MVNCTNRLLHGDCLELMQDIPDKSIDMILCDLPYGTTACKWDVIIPFEPLWKEYKRIIKDRGCIALFGSEPFSSYLRMSNIKNYKYDWIWNKKIPSGMSYAKFQPMRQHEIISIFNSNVYYPQMIKRDKPIKAGGMSKGETTNNQKLKALHKTYDLKFPSTIIDFMKIRQDSVHPTQKPVTLLEYLIKTYTLENEIVLDNCMGSGSTGVACINTNRNFIGIEKDETFFNIAKRRIEEAPKALFN